MTPTATTSATIATEPPIQARRLRIRAEKRMLFTLGA
jgi:hypothetical protein